MKRLTPITTGSTHHVFSKSISHFQIFNTPPEYERFFHILRYYRTVGHNVPFSKLILKAATDPSVLETALLHNAQNYPARVDIIAYCLMPTHFHLILHQNLDNGIERFLADVCNSYSHYFNLRHNRKGPLWQNRFGNSRIENQPELLETTRYLHLNPSTAFLVDHPADWTYSSFGEYTGKARLPAICQLESLATLTSDAHYEFYVVSHIEAHRLIKHGPRQLRELTKKGST
ncbi:MAG: hypothetical protein HGA80_00840 [Candidatus Omnitrophica bacterium]|nr:hypothetical protein [Candidatus Omnitrophota bacterium]